MDKIIYETDDLVVFVPGRPHVSREDGGHLVVRAKRSGVESRQDLEPAEAIQVMRLTMLVGAAMKKALQRRGIDVERINYQENGNWAFKKQEEPVFHIHLYGRARDEVGQEWGEALVLPEEQSEFYEGVMPLDEEDVAELLRQIEWLEGQEKYKLENWVV